MESAAHAHSGGRAVPVVHVWDCEEAPADGQELTVLRALDVLRRPGALPSLSVVIA
ncbi:hypothetical protein K4749_21805 [Streptomyces sp. TRM72054]|uniref:DUF6233 domain-containing protein n=1 Tax=Streptomyces sp. TRM72054 TaxID=2870562 RepID=UPI001C8BC92D|nr:hypothetical protein [Streptomyces sp. TRM72054]